jgi:Domain of unknown function (DUF1918)/Rv2632c-like
MDAHVGDQLVVRSQQVGRADQLGEITEVISTGGEHYRVRWSDGRETIFFPGPDATVQRTAPAAEPSGMETRTARIDLRLDEDGEHCEATATIRTSTGVFAGIGTARRNPRDPAAPMIGEEFAIARSLTDLAVQLEAAARAAMPAEDSAARHLVP